MFVVDNIEKFSGHKGAIYKIILSRYTNILYSTGGDGWIVKWDYHITKEGQLIATDDDNIFALVELDESILLAGTLQGNLLIVDLKHKTPRKIKLHRHAIYDILIVKNRIYTIGADGLLNELSCYDFKILNTFRISQKPLRRVICANDTDLYIAASDGKVYLFNIHTNNIVTISADQTKRAVFSLVENVKYGTIITGSMDAHLRIWDRELEILQESIPAHLFTINDMVIDSNNDLLFTASRDKCIKVWSSVNMQLLKVIDFQKFRTHTHSVNSLCIKDKELLVFSAGDDRQIVKIKYQIL